MGILHWANEVGMIYTFHETSLILQYQANPRIVHLEVLYHIFAYLKSHMRMGSINYDQMGPNVDL